MSASQMIHLIFFGTLLILIIRKLPEFSLNRSIALGMIYLGIFILGIAAVIHLPIELMPNIAYGNVTIFIDVRGGMPPPEVERLVTKPIEEFMGTVSHLRNLISSSKKDRSVITLEFDAGTDMDLAALEVREKFLRVKSKLPSEIEKPVISRYEESDAPVYIAALTSDRMTPEELRRLVDENLKEKLMRVDGVANVEVSGGRERKIVVDLDRDKLASFGFPIKKVVLVLEQNNLNLKSGDVQGTPTLNFGVRTVGAFRTIDDIRNIAVSISPNGGRVRLKDLGEVNDDFLENETYSRLNARSAVTVYVQKESASNTVKTVGQVEQEVEKFKKQLPKNTELVTISNHRKSILSAIESVKITLLYGIALVAMVLPVFLAKSKFSKFFSILFLSSFLFLLLFFYVMNWSYNQTMIPVTVIFAVMAYMALKLKDIRIAFVVAASIPASVFITLGFMYCEGITINVMSLSGLILGIGLLVDNAIVVIENYDRILSLDCYISPKDAMLKASNEVISPMIGGTLTTVVVFLPFSLLGKQTQILFSGISFAVTASLFSSLFVALSLVPALGFIIDPRKYDLTEYDLQLKVLKNNFLICCQKKLISIQMKYTLFSALPSLQGFRRFVEECINLDVKEMMISFSARNDSAVKRFIPVLIVIVFFIHFILKVPWMQSVFILGAAVLIIIGILMLKNYLSNLIWCLKNKKIVFGIMGCAAAVSILIFMFELPKDFLSSSEQNEFIVFIELDTGVRLDIADRIAKKVEQAVRDYEPTKKAVRHVSSKVEGWSAKVYVTLNDLSERGIPIQEVIRRLRQPVEKLVDEEGKDLQGFCYFSEPASGKEIFVEIFGYEYDLMAQLAMETANRMGKIPGLTDVKIRYRPGRPQMSVMIDPKRAALFGLDAKEIAESIHAQMRGLRATTFYEKSEEIETVVRIRPDQRETVDHLKNLFITNPWGEQIPVANLGKITPDLSPSEIWHRNKARMIQVSANLGNTPLQKSAESVRKILSTLSFPYGYYADIGGQYEDMVHANRDFQKALLLTFFLVFMVMACQFESCIQPFVIMGTVILSVIGTVAALSIFKSTVTMGVFVGILMLGGIAVNNGIMLMDRINGLRETKFSDHLETLMIEAGRQRIRPIFMTHITTVLGLVPMALDRSESAALWSPLAITVIGGIVSSTVLTLFVIPCVYQTVESLLKKYLKAKLVDLIPHIIYPKIRQYVLSFPLFSRQKEVVSSVKNDSSQQGQDPHSLKKLRIETNEVASILKRNEEKSGGIPLLTDF